jgi:hypothetical protein
MTCRLSPYPLSKDCPRQTDLSQKVEAKDALKFRF